MSHLASCDKEYVELPMVKRKALWLLLLTAPLSTILLIIILEGYGDIALFILGSMYLVPMELTVYLPASNLVVPILVAAQGTHSRYLCSKSHSGPQCS